jgi:EAL and modified HD-GYP domain-containing signal transduction protein
MFRLGPERPRREESPAGKDESSPASRPPNPEPSDDEAAAVPEPPVGQPIFIARQPIFDRNSIVSGYELLFRGSRENRFTASDIEAAAATAIEQGTTAFGLDELVGDRVAWVNLTRGALLNEFYRVLPRGRTVIELLESVRPDHDVLDACLRLKAEGYRLALDDYTFDPAASPLLAMADLVKVDFRQTGKRADARAIRRLRDRGIYLLAEKVETIAEHREAIASGYDLFQGYYYCHPEMVETRDIPPSRITQLRFLAEVTRGDTSFERLEELFRQDVALTTRLLRYLNSAAFGWRHEIASLRHALALIGLEPLRKWATMMGFVSLGSDRPRELVVTSLSRAHFAEGLAPASGLREQGLELFLTGMLSLMDAIVGRPMREVLNGLAVPESVRVALTGGDHPVGSVLRMVTAYERGDWGTLEAARATCPVEDRDLNDAYRRSLRWAEDTATV